MVSRQSSGCHALFFSQDGLWEEMLRVFLQVALIEIARRFGLALRSVHDELDVSGSPERTTFRVVIEDDQGQLYVVQSFTRARSRRKRIIAETIASLYQSGLSETLPYLPSLSGDLTVLFREHYWQARPYARGIPLPRPGWATETWRAQALADLLAQIRHCATALPPQLLGKPFSMQRYVERLSDDMREHHPHVLAEVGPALDYLAEKLWPEIDELPISFCHGDIHPLNIIWGQNGILALIDWEFCGLKPALYDLANLIGCAGVENPDALYGPMVSGLIQRAQASEQFSATDWSHLPAMVLAIRFAWLSEWLRKEDVDMIELEIAYMRLLCATHSELAQRWTLG